MAAATSNLFSNARHVIVRPAVPGKNFLNMAGVCIQVEEKDYGLQSGARKLLVIDGFERLNSLQRLLLVCHCRQTRAGLLVTTHRVHRMLPPVAFVDPKLSRSKAIVDYLLRNEPITEQKTFDQFEIESAFTDCNQDIREALMRMYDLYESKRQRVNSEIPFRVSRVP